MSTAIRAPGMPLQYFPGFLGNTPPDTFKRPVIFFCRKGFLGERHQKEKKTWNPVEVHIKTEALINHEYH